MGPRNRDDDSSLAKSCSESFECQARTPALAASVSRQTISLEQRPECQARGRGSKTRRRQCHEDSRGPNPRHVEWMRQIEGAAVLHTRGYADMVMSKSQSHSHKIAHPLRALVHHRPRNSPLVAHVTHLQRPPRAVWLTHWLKSKQRYVSSNRLGRSAGRGRADGQHLRIMQPYVKPHFRVGAFASRTNKADPFSGYLGTLCEGWYTLCQELHAATCTNSRSL